MNRPCNATDVASLVWADWNEEFGSLKLARQIREEVNEDEHGYWSFEWRNTGDVGAVGAADGGGGAGADGGVGAAVVGAAVVGAAIGVGAAVVVGVSST